MAVHPILIGLLLLVSHAVYITGQNATDTSTTADSMYGETSTTTTESSTTESTESKKDWKLQITVCVLGIALLICIVIIVILRLTAIKKRRISTTPPECDTQPLEVKNEEATSP